MSQNSNASNMRLLYIGLMFAETSIILSLSVSIYTIGVPALIVGVIVLLGNSYLLVLLMYRQQVKIDRLDRFCQEHVVQHERHHLPDYYRPLQTLEEEELYDPTTGSERDQSSNG